MVSKLSSNTNITSSSGQDETSGNFHGEVNPSGFEKGLVAKEILESRNLNGQKMFLIKW